MQNSSKEYLDECRNAMLAEQAASLAATDNWSHVDRAQVHGDWDALYRELTPVMAASLPASPEAQECIARHYAIASRFYVPSRQAYIGMALFYKENQGMKDFHNAYHPGMVEFLGDAIHIYAHRNLVWCCTLIDT